MTALRPRRSVLYMPGSNARALEKAKALPADALILDLEDAVAPDAKDLARDQVVAAVKAGGFGRREVAIRVNGLDTPWADADLAAAATSGADAVLVPKISAATDIHDVIARLGKAGAPQSLKIWAMMETPLAMIRAAEIAGSSERLDVLVMGTNDLMKELRCAMAPDRLALLPSLGLSLIAARAFGKVILDGVYNDIRDPAGFEAICIQGRDLGFDGKTLVHPDQVLPCNKVFSPSEAEIIQARKIVAAFDEAASQGKGVVTVDGRMIENLHVENAKRALALAAAVAEA